jgi:hypothetical protein
MMHTKTVERGYLVDYPSEYTGMRVAERLLCQAIDRAPVPPEITPILQKKSKH